MNNKKADFTANNFEVFEYQEGEIYIQTDAIEDSNGDCWAGQVTANSGRVYLRVIDLERLLKFARSTKGNYVAKN